MAGRTDRTTRLKEIAVAQHGRLSCAHSGTHASAQLEDLCGSIGMNLPGVVGRACVTCARHALNTWAPSASGCTRRNRMRTNIHRFGLLVAIALVLGGAAVRPPPGGDNGGGTIYFIN